MESYPSECVMRKFILFLSLFVWTSTSDALEINNYTASYSGIFHDVTVAFDDMNKRAKVRCLIKLNGKPVGKKDAMIDGVGTIQIMISGGALGDTTASCVELQ